MKQLLKIENAFPGIKALEVFDFVLAGDDSYYPIVINDKSFHLKMSAEGLWRVEGLSEDIGDFLGEVVERQGFENSEPAEQTDTDF